ncbi:MAG TPA: CocE/NonD family hydrolase [Conexibacter sp.]|nr:CocE/NonD family hydrolase [Conexibacter sp.]
MTGSAHLVRVAMPGGAALATAVALPHAGFHGPALLVRTPYEGDLHGSTRGLELEQVLAAGFALVAQDVRGRAASTGRFGFIAQERDDGRRTLAWIASQPWSDGRVATAGASYLGRAQLVLGDARPVLAAMIPAGAGLGSADTWRPGGTVDVAVAGSWIRTLGRERLDMLPPADAERMRALLDGDDPVAPVRAALTAGHPLRGLIAPLLPALDGTDERAPAPSVPSLHICGWFDGAGGGTIDAWSEACAGGGGHHLIVGPWAHDHLGDAQGDCTFPAGAADAWGLAARQLAFLACYIHGEGERPPVAEVYVTGANAWRTCASWPPPTVERELLLTGEPSLALVDWATGPRRGAFDAGGGAATADARAATALVLASHADDPAPALGGPSTGIPVPGRLQMREGPVDLAPLAARDDVAVLRSPAFEAPAELAGAPRLTAWVASDRSPAGLVARLAEVTPDGRMTTLAAGVATAPAPAGEPVRLDVALSPLHHRVAAGSRLALLLAASSYPHYLLGLDRDRTQRVLTGDAGRAARLLLPLVR